MVGDGETAAAPGEERARILHVIESLGRGGAEQALVSLVAAQVERGHEVGVVALSRPYDLAGPLERAGARVWPTGLRRGDLVRGTLAVRSAGRRLGADVVHAHLALAIVASELASITAKWDVVVTFHIAGYELFPAATKPQRARKAFEALLTRHLATRAVAVSTPVARHYEQHFRLPDGSVEVIPNPFPTDELDPARWPRNRELLHSFNLPDVFFILMPARFVAEKGHEVLLNAISILVADGRPVAALLAGDGPTRSGIDTAIQERGLTDVVKVTRALPRDEVLALMTAADVVVLPSRLEGLPLTVGEALLLARPVVATAVGGVPELIEDGVSGLLVPPGDPERLAAALAHVADDPVEAAARGTAARTRLATTLAADTIAARLDRIYGLPRRRQ